MTAKYWITGTAGDWSTASDWLSGAVPTSTDDVVINNSTAVTVNGTAAADSLILNSSQITVSGSLAVGTSLTLNSASGQSEVVLNDGSLSTQSIVLSNGVLAGNGVITGVVSGSGDIEALSGVLKVEGSFTGYSGNFYIGSSATLELSNGGASAVYFSTLSTLKLDTPSAFTGLLGNVVLGDTIGLAGITANSASFNNGILTVNEANGQRLAYNLSGSVAGDIVNVASDGNGGTNVYWTAPPPPSVASISATTDNKSTDVNAGHLITITVDTSEVVNVAGTPALQLNDNEVATYTKGTGTNTLTFAYTVQPGDNSADLQVTGLNLNGGSIQDVFGTALSGPVQGDLALQIDTTPPTPLMSDVIKNSNNNLTTLSGMSEAGSTVSVFDGTKPLGTVKADSLGNWSLQTNISAGTHQFTETATDLAGNSGASTGVTVYAPTGHQTLTGGNGNDFLIGGTNDKLIGGAGNDTFVFNQGFGKETVADFNPNQDQLAFNHALFTQDTAAQILSQAHDTGAGAVIVVDPHDTVTLTGVTVAQLAAHQSWIHFF
jgi:hypothetical protein